MSSDNEELPGSFTHSRVSASDAPKPDTKAPNSVFALGAGAVGTGGTDDGTDGAESGQFDRADAAAAVAAANAKLSVADGARDVLPVFEACGQLSVRSMTTAVAGMSYDRASRIVRFLNDQGALVESERRGREIFYKLKVSGFKGWLAKQGTKQAGAAAPAKKRGRPQGSKSKPKATAALPDIMPVKAPRKAAAVLTAAADPAPRWRGALRSDGLIEIEANGSKVELDGPTAAGVYAWLHRLNAAGLAGGADA